MKQDIILAGVGGQGILSIAFVIDNAALHDGLNFKQAEIHGMAQRGGAVQSHVRLANENIFSDLITKAEADIILSVEPLEALRYADYLKPGGFIVTSITPFRNISDYPDMENITGALKQIENTITIDSEGLAREAGSIRAQNMVMLGAASAKLIVKKESLLEFIEVLFVRQGKKLVDLNIQAFQLGGKAAENSGIVSERRNYRG